MAITVKPEAARDHRREQVERWVERLRSEPPRRVLLCDGDDPRAVRAAGWLVEQTPVRPVLLARDEVSAASGVPGGVEVVTPPHLAGRREVRDLLVTRRDGRSRSGAEVDELLADPLYLGAGAVATGAVDACVGGATRPTAEVIRAAISVIGLCAGTDVATSCFLMILPDGRRLAFADCAVLPRPDAGQLALVARATARTYRDLTGEVPVVAMLSFSTFGSARHPDAERVRAATEIVRAAEPGLAVDGELQFDAAMVASVGRAKAPGSPVAGHANVLVFPDLGAGNIGYKITERLGGATAIGPILQGLSAPMHDLSRGCTAEDIAMTALLSAVQGHANATPHTAGSC